MDEHANQPNYRWQLSLRRLLLAIAMLISGVAMLRAIKILWWDLSVFDPVIMYCALPLGGALIGAAIGLLAGRWRSMAIGAAAGVILALVVVAPLSTRS